MIDEAVLGIVSSLDAPGSPAGEVKQAYHQMLYGNLPDVREQKRKSFLEVKVDDIYSVADTYLKTEPSRAVITSENNMKELSSSFHVFNVNA